MKRYIQYLLLLVFIVIFWGSAYAGTYESISLINSTNFAKYFDDYLGYPYESHGCLHFTPSDIYLLVKTIPNGTPLRIKKYDIDNDDIHFSVTGVPYLRDITNNPQDIEKHAQIFKNKPTKIIVYPSLNKLYVVVNGNPYAQMDVLAGPASELLMAFDVRKGKAVDWDFMLTTPTDPGNYTVLRSTSHYLSSSYYKSTVIPFGSWILMKDGKWVFQKGNDWYRVPQHIINDMRRPSGKRLYNYYDISNDEKGKIKAARWAGHDFGKYVLLWTKDGKTFYPEMGYAAGELLFEQVMFIKDLVHLLTIPGQDDFDACISQSRSFSFSKEIYEFVTSKGEFVPKQVQAELLSYYKLYNGFELSADDFQRIDSRLLKAFDEYKNNRLPRKKTARRKALGLVYFLKINSEVIDKEAGRYGKLKRDWEFWKELRIKMKNDFDEMGVLAVENRQNIVEGWLNDRLEFELATPPTLAKNLQTLSFSSFFETNKSAAIFLAREKAAMRKLVSQAGSADVEELKLHSVKALNEYNFGLLLNEILGDLYKSHGCMHVSPRNMYFLFELLSVKTQVTVFDYSKKITDEQLEEIPYLANMVNFADDLQIIKEQFLVTKEVKVAVYPSSGYWIIYNKGEPFAKLQVKGGPQTKMYLVQGRTQDGKPIFEDHLAYPTSTGTFFVFKKEENYLSNIYRDQTIIPMGGRIIKKEENKWAFQDKKGKWGTVPNVIHKDLNSTLDEREYRYYDLVRNASGEVIEAKWGSHPFGRYSLLTTVDFKRLHPELIHSSGDLILEERQLIDDLIKVLAAPLDELEKCVKYSQNFDLYKTCYDFVNDPNREDLIQPIERVSYRLYFDLPLTTKESSMISRDLIIANKILKNKGQLTNEEVNILIDEGIAYRRGGKLKINMEKVLGLQFDTYQYVVAIQKYAHHYETLKKYWNELSSLRRALLKDFNNYVIKDAQLFHDFTRELMVKRTSLERLSQHEAIEKLTEMLGEDKD